MKKLFICVMTSLCSTLAFADADLVVKPAAIYGSNGTMEVVINKANTTAFQFDVKLPAGISVSAFGTESGDRKFEKNQVDASTNTWRFLSYDEKNATFDAGTTFNVTLAAGNGANGGDAETAGILLVDPEGTGTSVDGSSTNISLGAKITIPAGKNLAMVSDKNLDFTTLEAKGVKAYICAGYEIVDAEHSTFWMTRVTDVPANTPILVRGEAGDYDVPAGVGSICYPQTFMYGDATNKFAVDKSEGYKNYAVAKSTGVIGTFSNNELDAGKAYFHVPATITPNVADAKQNFTMGKGGNLACVSNYDLDFTQMEAQGLKAYVVTGFSKSTIWLTPVKTVPAKTPLFLRGSSEATYNVPSSAASLVYSNMLKGNTTGSDMNLNPEEDGYTIYAMSMKTGVFGTLSGTTTFKDGKAWLPVPTTFYNSFVKPAASRGMISESLLEEAEVIGIMASSIGGEDNGTTGIRALGEIQTDDAWYNLSGQRIDTPTKKGLYIKNGKKVVVK